MLLASNEHIRNYSVNQISNSVGLIGKLLLFQKDGYASV